MRPDQESITTTHYDLDLRRFSDEALVILFKECGYSLARRELLRRNQVFCHHLIRRLAGRWGLQDADRQDLEQEAILWIVEAIRRYRTEESVRTGGCRFRSFLHRVLHARCIDTLRQRQRRIHRIHLRSELPRPYNADLHAKDVDGESFDYLAEGRESRDRLQQEVDRLTPPSRTLWFLLLAGVPLRNIADELQVSYDTAKRRRRKLIAGLQAYLRMDSAP